MKENEGLPEVVKENKPDSVSSLSNIVAGTSDPVAIKGYDVFSQLDPELQALTLIPSEDRAELANGLMKNVHNRLSTGGVISLAIGAGSLLGGGVLSIFANNMLSISATTMLLITGFVLCAFGLQTMLGKKPSGKEAKELTNAILQKNKISQKQEEQ